MTGAKPLQATTARVMATIDEAFGEKHFTTFEVAAEMRIAEYSVRAAVSWLLKFNAVKRIGSKKCFTKPVRRERCHYRPGKCEPYWATTYARVPENAVDFDALFRVLSGGKYDESGGNDGREETCNEAG